MRTERRTVVVLLSVIAVLLTVNVLVMGTRRAEAQAVRWSGTEAVLRVTFVLFHL